MNLRELLFVTVTVALTVAKLSAATNIAIPSPAEIVARLRPGHPRLLATASDFSQLKQRVASDAQLKAWHEELRREAEKLLTQPPSKYEIPDGLRLLSVSRRVLHRTQLLALLHRLDRDNRWRDRAWKELEAAAQFPDWNPRHFLDTAEMTHAFAIGYDWLFAAWTPEQRATLRAAMVEKGLKPAVEIYRKKSGWTRARHNWNQVCNGGIGMGALALADEEPHLAGEFLHDACVSIQLPAYAGHQRRLASPAPLDLLWYDAKLAEDSRAAVLPLDKHFRGADIVTLRSAWNDRDALFAGFKAGDNKANHSHLDLGSFVFDALGQRWAVDLGAENYNLPGYFGKARWTYYRLRAEGQNALVLNPGAGSDQEPAAAARLERFESTPGRAFAIAELTPAYAKHARSVRRGVALLDRQRLLVQDEVRGEAPVDAWWFMHTPAEIEIAADGHSATLKQGDATLRAELLSPANARFETRPAEPLPGSPNPERQNRNAGIRKLTIHLVDSRELRIAVLLTPRRTDRTSLPVPSVRSLAEW